MRKTGFCDITAVILAAGKGVRMNSHLPKVLVPVAGKPMIRYIIEKVRRLDVHRIVIVANNENLKPLKKMFKKGVEFVIQEIPLGTADAVIKAEGVVDTPLVLILCGDVPAIKVSTLKKLVRYHKQEDASCTILTAIMENPKGYGRIVRNGNGYVDGIVEEKDATPELRKIKEVNSGIYVFNKELLFESLEKVKPSMVTGEYYLTDVVHILKEKGEKICAFAVKDWMEVAGVNTKSELQRMESYLRGGR